MTKHRLESFSRKLKTLEHRSNRQLTKIEARIETRHGTRFVLTVAEYDLHVEEASLDEAYDKICTQIDEKTAVEWEPFLMVKMSSGVNTDFLSPKNRMDEGYGVHLDLEVRHLEIGTAPDGKKLTREFGSSISDGEPEVGRETRSWTHNSVELDTLDSCIRDTPQNREALVLLAVEFERLYAKLNQLLDPKTIQRTLNAAAARGLLTAGTGKKR